MPPQSHREGDLRQIKLLESNCGDMLSTNRGNKVATHLTEEVILDKSNCGDMMSTKRGEKVATHLTEEVIFVGTAEGSSST